MTDLLCLDQVAVQATVGSTYLLRGISGAIAPGEFIGIVGPSGAGKTTLFRLLNRLQDPTAGEISFQGQPLKRFPVIPLRQQIMLVAQESHLLGMTVAQALQYPLQLQGVTAADRQERVQTWLELCQISPQWLSRSEVELSGGQRQRVAIARALVAQPLVLLLDEPTAAQDVGAATHLLAMLQGEIRQRGLTVLMSNHQLELVEEFCDRVWYLNQGQLVGDWPATVVDWPALRQTIITANATETAEWGA